MNRAKFSVVLIAVLFGLLALLGTLQYRWLGQISEGEREKIEKRLQIDTEHYAEDFNQEIQAAYYTFQIPPENWKEKDWRLFNERMATWKTRNPYPDLIKDFYFSDLQDNQKIYKYNFARETFELLDANEKADFSPDKFPENIETATINESLPALLIPIFDSKKIDYIFLRNAPSPSLSQTPPELDKPSKVGTLLVKFDQDVITNKILPDLTRKYFGVDENAEYKVAVSNQEGNTILQTRPVNFSDAKIKIFDLTPGNFVVTFNQQISVNAEKKQGIFVGRSIERKNVNRNDITANANRSEIGNEQSSQVAVFDNKQPEPPEQKGVWTLSIQHTDGSLTQFLAKTRRQSLLISFGILLLLAGSIILIFISTRRAQILAQRQLDFVSSVSHEFRTPLSVIYSAGENLADGVAKETLQVARYGNLIKDEGKKLSTMVEQILDFAGANSGRKKYDFRLQNPLEIVSNALDECQPMLHAKNFSVVEDFAEKLPKINADKNALSQAIQNLIVNSVKYSNGKSYLKVSTRNANEEVEIAIEDHGIGIAQNDLKHVFEPFYRAKFVVDEQIHGNGLGLSLVKKTVAAHGGKVTVESRLGQGTKFTIYLPVAGKTTENKRVL